MMQFFQRLLGKKSAPAPIRGPLGLHLNAGFTLVSRWFHAGYAGIPATGVVVAGGATG